MFLSTLDQVGMYNRGLELRFQLEKSISMPHPRRHVLEMQVQRRHRIALEQIGFMYLEYGQSNPEEDVHPIDEEHVPDAEQRFHWEAVGEQG